MGFDRLGGDRAGVDQRQSCAGCGRLQPVPAIDDRIAQRLVDGPLGAFRLFSRRAHRVVDVVVIVALAVAAVIPWIDIDATSRILLGAGAAVLAVVWWNSAFESRRSRAAAAVAQQDRSEAIGRGAGRLAGNIAKAVRDRSKPA